MTGVPPPAGWDQRDDGVWRLRGAVGRPCVNVYVEEARGPLRLDSKTTLPPAPRRVAVDVHRWSGWFTDPAHLETLARGLQAAADWLRTPTADPDAGDQLSFPTHTEEVPTHGA